MQWSERHAELEAILFASGEAIPLAKLSEVLGEPTEGIEVLCAELMDEYRFHRRGLRLLRLEDRVQMVSAPEYAEGIRAILEERKSDRLSRSSLEVLSIIAYHEPATKTYVEQVRGVDSSYTIGLLLDRDLIEDCGRLDVPGRPILYRTTQSFLRAFGLSSKEELPELPSLEKSQEEKGSG